MSDTPETHPQAQQAAGFKYWKLAIFKGVNGYFMAMAMAFLAFTDGEDWRTPEMRTARLVLFCLAAGHKFLDGFFDQTFSLLKSLKEQFASISDNDKPPTEPTNAMKIVKALLACCLTIALLIPACITVKRDPINPIERKAFAVTQLVATKYLQAHPGYKVGFELARDDLKTLAASETMGLPELLEIVDRLPALEDTDAALYIEFGITFFTDELGTVAITNPQEVRYAAAGMAKALDKVLPLVK